VSRGLSTAAKNYVGPTRWAVKITLRDATVLNLSEDDFTFLGTAYKPYLRGAGPFTFTKSQQSDNGEIELLNADGFISAQLEAKNIAWAKCEVKLLLLSIEEEVTLLVGKLTDPQLSRETVSFRVIGQLDPAGLRVPLRDFTVECPWKYKSPECGSVSVLTTCDKDFASCTARAATHRFGGFPTLTQAINTAAAGSPGIVGSGGGGGGEDDGRGRMFIT
jgi:phage-related protein